MRLSKQKYYYRYRQNRLIAYRLNAHAVLLHTNLKSRILSKQKHRLITYRLKKSIGLLHKISSYAEKFYNSSLKTFKTFCPGLITLI